MLHYVLRVVVLTTLFMFSQNVWPKKVTENLETYKDQISKAQVLLLQHDRNQAAQIIIAAINREGTKSPSYGELTSALKKTVEIFFSEKAQQSYEMALSAYSTNKSQAIDKLNETLRLESGNGLVLKGLAFALLSQRECGNSARFRSDYFKLNPFDEDNEKLRFLELVCQKNKSEALIVLAKLDASVLNQSFWVVNKQRIIPEEFGVSNFDSRILQESSPEISYLGWLFEKDQKKRMALAEKYKNLCHTAIPFDKAYSWMDPWACEHLKEIDEFHGRGN